MSKGVHVAGQRALSCLVRFMQHAILCHSGEQCTISCVKCVHVSSTSRSAIALNAAPALADRVQAAGTHYTCVPRLPLSQRAASFTLHITCHHLPAASLKRNPSTTTGTKQVLAPRPAPVHLNVHLVSVVHGNMGMALHRYYTNHTARHCLSAAISPACQCHASLSSIWLSQPCPLHITR